ncbi:heterokaryon incompatibility protein-domain-containing protein [Dichomitus squalens]|uniref:Heterokaryon incompatibility protein-domain-containing protein n=2 Tax=Dichomitus squalens TaxID=114155 RepID=A0A4Q9N2N3_9APHY|nr:heterokaryon incompatibility protein-domain-containing protein [Dichomitus squalens]
MRLLNTFTGAFESFDDPRAVRYAILSHVWQLASDHGQSAELSYQQLLALQDSAADPVDLFDKLSAVAPKVYHACQVAKRDGFRYIWIDSCCIDKASSAELTESINSMFDWYRSGKACYAYLHDVNDGLDPKPVTSKFCRSRWFTRGWTLQELLAPCNVLFLSKDWRPIESKYVLASTISRITGIPIPILRHEQPLSTVPVAQRMSWAYQRQTTKIEDQAYCLLGMFDINMTPIYGEGREAFIRLQQSILEHIPDQSILAWGPRAPFDSLFSITPPSHLAMPSVLSLQHHDNRYPESYLLASSPHPFISATDIAIISPESLAHDLGLDQPIRPKYETTPYGIRTKCAIMPMYDQAGIEHRLAFLACRETRFGNLVALVLCSRGSNHLDVESMYVGAPDHRYDHESSLSPYRSRSTETTGPIRLVSLSRDDVSKHRDKVIVAKVSIRYSTPNLEQLLSSDEPIHAQLQAVAPLSPALPPLVLAQWRCNLLEAQGYRVLGPTAEQPGLIVLKPDNADRGTINIHIDRCACEYGARKGGLRARVDVGGDIAHPLFLLSTRLNSIGHLPCRRDHIKEWEFHDGIATQTYASITSGQGTRFLRLSLTLDDPRSSTSPYILDVEVSESPSADVSRRLPLVGHSRAATMDYRDGGGEGERLYDHTLQSELSLSSMNRSKILSDHPSRPPSPTLSFGSGVHFAPRDLSLSLPSSATNRRNTVDTGLSSLRLLTPPQSPSGRRDHSWSTSPLGTAGNSLVSLQYSMTTTESRGRREGESRSSRGGHADHLMPNITQSPTETLSTPSSDLILEPTADTQASTPDGTDSMPKRGSRWSWTRTIRSLRRN